MKKISKILFILLSMILVINVNAIELEKEQVNESNSSDSLNQKEKNYLSSLSLSSGNINFDKNTFNYETKVLYDIENIEILAIPEEDAQIDIIGNKKLLVGKNKIEVRVTLYDHTTSYIIMVTRLEEGETLGNNPNIKNIEIKNYSIEFKPDKFEYKLVIKNEEKLDIKVTMEDESSIYEIMGNNNLKDGSVIKIKTTSSDETEKLYTIAITKSNYVPYIIITFLVLLIPIMFLLVNYLKLINKKENVDINGYKIDKEYFDPLTTRKVISNKGVKENLLLRKKTKKPKFKSSKIGTTKSENKIELDSELKSYDPNEKK